MAQLLARFEICPTDDPYYSRIGLGKQVDCEARRNARTASHEWRRRRIPVHARHSFSILVRVLQNSMIKR